MKQGDLFGGPVSSSTDAPAPKPAGLPSVTAPAGARSAPDTRRSEQTSLASGPPPAPPRPVVPAEPARPRVDPPAPVEKAVPAWRKPEPATKKILSVSELTFQIKENLETRFSRVIVRGEVTGFRAPNARGHLYFSIKDARAQIDVIVWQTQARALKFQLRDGLSVIIEGPLNVYEVSGRYSLIADRLEPEGVGARALAFEQLKAKLTKEGVIGEGRRQPKRPLPSLPRRIGVVTSSSGAAWRDFLKVLHRRHPKMSVLFCNARVQGEDAPIEIARGLRWLGKTDVDVVVVTRGGGSAEDLWAFNEERVVRAIFDCPVPVVSAVGHEIDVTLADLVADYRAPTPSAAAEAVVPVLAELELRLKTTRRRLTQAMERRVLEARHRLQAARGTLGDPRRQLSSRRLRLSELAERSRRGAERSVRAQKKRLEVASARLARSRPQTQLAGRRAALTTSAARLKEALARVNRRSRERLHALRLSLERASPVPRLVQAKKTIAAAGQTLPAIARRQLEAQRVRLRSLEARLDALSPLRVLGRGYAIVSAGPHVVRRARDVSRGDQLTVRLDRGDSLTVRVEQTQSGPGEE
jgi:exodeoxyribonuclease VII large subunit